MHLPKTTRIRHRLLGLVMLLPFIAWSLTAAFFLIQPGYGAAYERITVRHYPLASTNAITVQEHWLETRQIQTVLGTHLLVRDASGWQHLHATDLSPWPVPDPAALTRLLTDALSANPTRYGSVVAVSGTTAETNTGIQLALDWPTLTLSQQGNDTRRIDWLYSIHYLQWTGIDLVDKFLGVAGLALLLCLTVTGGRLAFGWEQKAR